MGTCCRALAAALWLACPLVVHAVDRSWVNPLGGLYNTPANWNGNIVPGPADNGIFNLNAGVYTVSFSAGVTSGGMIVRNEDLQLNLSGFNLVLSSVSGLTLGDQSGNFARLTIRNGGLSSNNVTLAPHALAVGVATITSGGTLNVGSLLSVGSVGVGSLNILGGGRLTTATVDLGGGTLGSGSLTVSGSDSAWTSGVARVGYAGTGTARVLGGGTASFDSLVLGFLASSSGRMKVDGAGSSVAVTSALGGGIVGNHGGGTLSITNAGVVTASTFTLGADSNGTGGVFVESGGSFSCSGSTAVGSAGRGEFSVRFGGQASSNSLVIGALAAPSAGSVVVSDGGRFAIAGSTHVGGLGAGTLQASGGTFITGTAAIGEGTLSTGRLIVDAGGSFTSDGSVNIGVFGTGTATVNTSGDVSCAALTLGQSSSGRGAIDISGTGSTWSATTLTVGGWGSGEIRITSGALLTSTTADIAAELGSTGAVYVSGNNARWSSTGSVSIGGGPISGGSGLLEIGIGGNVQIDSLLHLTSAGVVNLNGGTLSISGLQNGGGLINFNSGTFNVTSPAGFGLEPSGPLGSVLELRSNQALGVNATFSIGLNSQLTIDGGRVLAGVLNNMGELVLRSPTSHLTATVVNTGQLRGQGSIFGVVNNLAGGQIRPTSGETLRVFGPVSNSPGSRIDLPGGILQPAGLDNAGQVFLDGGVLDAATSVVNQASGRISGRGRIITGSNFINSGTLSFTSGITDIEGSGGVFINTATGRVIITGNSTTNFFKPVTNTAGSEMRVSSGATAVYFEPVDGLSAFTGSGTVIFESAASIGQINRIGSTVVGTSGSLTATHVRENLLEVNGQASVLPNGTATGTSRVQQLLIAGELAPVAWLDLSDNDLVIDYTGASPLLTIATQLRNGYAAGSWTGQGIRSSTAGSADLALGFSEASAIFSTFPASFSGQLVDSSSLLIAYTLYGDANLDGIVNLADFNRLAAHFGSTHALWSDGDFNYDGIVNLNDFNRLAANFGLAASGWHVTPEDWAALASTVPEPAVGIIPVVTLVLGRRRMQAKSERARLAGPNSLWRCRLCRYIARFPDPAFPAT
jgi:T5SS/PEP-CTERM-associated repeat protein